MRHARLGIILTTAALIVAGCQADKNDPLVLGRGEMMHRDYAAAQGHFDDYLKAHPAGPRTAEVYYLKGRAFEDPPSEDVNAFKAHFQQARLAYIDALKAGTDSRALEGLIRASLADVAFWQEDYTTAAQQGVDAYPLLDDKTTRAWCLFNSGRSLQRLGRFDDADRTLKAVVSYHAGTKPAELAKQTMGLRAFVVRVPFGNPMAASGAAASLGKQGYAATADAMMGPGVTVGPFTTYAEASATRGRLEAQYPTAAVVP